MFPAMDLSFTMPSYGWVTTFQPSYLFDGVAYGARPTPAWERPTPTADLSCERKTPIPLG